MRAQTVQQILKQPSEDVMAVSQNQAVKGRFLFAQGDSECGSHTNHMGYRDLMKKNLRKTHYCL